MRQKIPKIWKNDAKFPNSRGMGRIPKMAKISPVNKQFLEFDKSLDYLVSCLFVSML
jgi:hypothetical protein